MYFIPNNNITDPRINLALEEYCLKRFDPSHDYLLFYVNDPSIIVGRFQNTVEEINPEFVEANNIHVVRRNSGGGAVYHDHGNLNFSFMTRYARENLLNFRKFTQPVIRVLAGMGVDAELTGRNDIVVAGKKISGNAQYATRTAMLSHGTLLFDSDMSTLVKALHVSDDKITSKALKSVRSRVTNIRECAPRPVDMETFRNRLLETVFAPYGDIRTRELDANQWAEVHELARTKYDSWEWNFGKSPRYNVKRRKRFPIGIIDVRIQVAKGVMTGVKIFGDFFGHGEILDLETLLTDIPYTREALEQCLKGVDLSKYFGAMETDCWIAFLLGHQ
ncbi:lipoate--protein ligase [Desulfoplanes formicivorans]|uniref:lipoate--protein ligase n=1 Tax=Desulfoplanes formicivorans TaxID=1592317 RepID=A0A194AH59_9BACT|nr:lipoate--protein ligase [Desulfoplanes formicivorans]GAU09417.1 lipoate--protein ligase [Desulfoplanes formicivorans]